MNIKNIIGKALMLPALIGTAGLAAVPPVPLAQTDTAGGVPISDALQPSIPNMSGKWINATPQVALTPVGGGQPPLNARGKAQFAKHKANMEKDPINRCLMHGIPRLMFSKYPFLIMQYDEHVDFLHAVNHTFRIVYFDEKSDPDADPAWLGHPRAKWDKRTLVIQSNRYHAETWLDYAGLPHSDELTTEERYTLLPDGNTIAGTVTITDPNFYTRPWTASFSFTRLAAGSLEQYSCMADHHM